MVAKITVTGTGGITTDDDGTLSTWTVNESATPTAIGQATAATGNISFTGVRDETDGNFSEWAINNPAIVEHSDDGGGTDLGSISGTISTVTVSDVVSGSMGTDLARLTASRRAGAVYDLTNTGSWDVPEANTALARGIGRDEDTGYIHAAFAQAVTGGDSVVTYDRLGNQIDSWGIRGTASAEFGALYAFAVVESKFYVGMDQSGFKVKVYTSPTDAAPVVFGSTGSGNGQFQAISDIDVDDAGNIYVLDGTLNRVQKFNAAGSYQLQWGSTGSGTSQFTAASRLTVSMGASPLVSVLDTTDQDIKTYDASGVYQYTYTGATGEYITDICKSSIYFYYSTLTEIRRIVVPTGSGNDVNKVEFVAGTASLPSQRTVYLLVGQNDPDGTTLVDGNDLFLFVGTSFPALVDGVIYRYFDWLGATLSQVYEYYFWLIEQILPVPNFAFSATNRTRLVYRAWEDSVWTKLNELAAATLTEIVVVGGVRTVRDMASTDQAVTSWDGVPQVAVGTLNAAQSLDVIYQNISNNLGLSSLLYDARNDENRVYSAAAGAVETFVITLNGSANFVETPVMTDILANFLNGVLQISYYMVSGSDNLPVVAAQWAAYGGSLTAAVTGPDKVTLTLTAPATEIPGVPGPYKLAVSDGTNDYATLKLWGAGLVGTPKTLTRHTAADPEKVTQESQTTITNYFVNSKADAYEASTWAVFFAGGPSPELSGSVPIGDLTAFGIASGARIEEADAKWRIESDSVTNSRLSPTSSLHTRNEDLTDVWGASAVVYNYATNPSFEGSGSGALTGYTAGTLTTASLSTTWAQSGTYSMRLSTTTNSGHAYVGSATVGGGFPWAMVAGRTYTISGYVHSAFPGGGSWLTDAGMILVEYANSALNNQMLARTDALASLTADARQSVTFTIPLDATALKISFYATGIGTNWFAYWDAIMVTPGSLTLDYFDGSTSGASWLGSAGSSASLRPFGNAGDFVAYWDGNPSENFKLRPLRYPTL